MLNRQTAFILKVVKVLHKHSRFMLLANIALRRGCIETKDME
jgi:hypothetical protein